MTSPKRKKPHRPLNVKIITIWIVLLAAFMSELLFYTWCRVQCTQLGYAISRATLEKQNNLAFQSNLKIESVRLQSPQRIAGIARNQLGMSIPGPDQVILLP